MSNLIVLSEANFNTEIAAGTVLVDFWAPWCGPCRMIGPIVEELAEDFAGKAKICKLNVDDNNATAVKYNVMTIPTLIIFKDGNEVERIVGVRPKPELAAAVTKHM